MTRLAPVMGELLSAAASHSHRPSFGSLGVSLSSLARSAGREQFTENKKERKKEKKLLLFCYFLTYSTSSLIFFICLLVLFRSISLYIIQSTFSPTCFSLFILSRDTNDTSGSVNIKFILFSFYCMLMMTLKKKKKI